MRLASRGLAKPALKKELQGVGKTAEKVFCGIVVTSPLALRSMCDSPRTECARRTTPHVCGVNKQ